MHIFRGYGDSAPIQCNCLAIKYENWLEQVPILEARKRVNKRNSVRIRKLGFVNNNKITKEVIND